MASNLYWSRIVMLRHGESEWNKENRFCGWYDAELTEKGEIYVRVASLEQF